MYNNYTQLLSCFHEKQLDSRCYLSDPTNAVHSSVLSQLRSNQIISPVRIIMINECLLLKACPTSIRSFFTIKNSTLCDGAELINIQVEHDTT